MSSLRRALVIAASAVAVAMVPALPAGAAASPGRGLLVVKVLVDFGCPGPARGSRCEHIQPLPGARLEIARLVSGNLVGPIRTAVSAPDGIVRLGLSAGRYRITPQPTDDASRAPARTVRIVSRATTTIR